MKKKPGNLSAEPFFLETELGKRFCLYHPPHTNTVCHGTFIYIHPFGEEMNKSRRVAAQQARAFAASGYGVLQIDLFGCGDSCGEFREASWNIWKQDLMAAWRWLENHTAKSINLWGLRLGALLALDFARSSNQNADKIILWQPIINGKSFLTQFLRLKLVNKLLSDDSGERQGVQTMRDALAAGTILEVAGYELNPDLAAAIDHLKINELAVNERTVVHWFDIGSEAKHALTPAMTNAQNKWEKAGNKNLHIHFVSCLPFWATQEITECPELISATSKLFGK